MLKQDLYPRYRVPIYTVREKVTVKERVVVKEPVLEEESLTSALLDYSGLTDAKEQLSLIDGQIRDRLYAEYLSQCADIAPYLRSRGRRWGLPACMLRSHGNAGHCEHAAACQRCKKGDV